MSKRKYLPVKIQPIVRAEAKYAIFASEPNKAAKPTDNRAAAAHSQ